MSAGLIKDIAAFLETKVITIDNDATAGSTGDNTEVTPSDDIDVRPYESGVVHISYVTTLAENKTLSFGLQEEHSDTDGGSKSTDATLLASTVVATGAAGGSTGLEGTYDIPVPAETLKSLGAYVNFLVTPDLSASGTDTATWSAVFIGLKRNVD